MAGIRIELLGRCRVLREGHALADSEIGSRKGRTLLRLLAVRPGSAVPLDEIVEVLWGEAPPPKARANVASLVSRLRVLLGPEAIEGTGAGYRFQGGPAIEVDVREAALLVDEGEARLPAGEPALGLAASERALELLGRGRLLEDEPDAAWLAEPQAEVDRLLRRTRRGAWEAALALGDDRRAIDAAEAAVGQDPLDEEAHRALMRAHRQAGRQGAALAAFERLRALLMDELGADPSPETRELHLAILREEPGAVAVAVVPPAEPIPGQPGFVGREAELGELLRAWSAAVGGAPSLVLVSGEAGIGKTRLTSELVAAAARTGAFVLAARCYEAERSLFLQPVLEAVRPALVLLRPETVRELAGEAAGTLADVIPELGRILRPIRYERAAPEIERRRVFEALTSFGRGLARRQPVLLILDDLQNAGASTVEFLHYLVRRVGSDRVLAVATVRSDDEGEVLAQLGELAQDLRLGPLSEAAVADLARQMGASEDLGPRVARMTRGHTLFAVEALRALGEGGGGGSPIPDSLRAAVLVRVRRTGPDVEELLRAAATFGPAFDLATVAELLEVPEEEAARRAERALRGRLLVEAGPSYEFANDLIQEVLYETTPAPTRATRHRRAALLSHDNPEAVATHAAAAGDWDRAADAWVRAADRASRRYANRDAVRMLDHALEAVEATGDHRAEAGIRLARGRVREALGDWPGAFEDQIRAVDLARSTGDREVEMWSLRELGGDLQIGSGGHTVDCVPNLERALALAEELGDAPALVSSLSRLCIVWSNRLRFDQGIGYGRRALDVARAAGSETTLVLALDGLKMAAAYSGDFTSFARYAHELEPLLRRRGDLHLLTWLLHEASFGPAAAGRYEDADALLDQALAMADRIEERRVQVLVLATQGWIARTTGRYAAALSLGEAARSLAARNGHAWQTSFAETMLSWTALELGRPKEAVALAAQAVAAAERDGAEGFVVRAVAQLAWASASSSDLGPAGRAAARAEEILGGIGAPPNSTFLHGGHAFVAAARARLARGEHDAVEALLSPLLPMAVTAPWFELVADASVVLGRSRLVAGDLAGAGDLLGRGLEVAAIHGPARAVWEANAALAELAAATGASDEAILRGSAAAEAVAHAALGLPRSVRNRFSRHALAILGL